MLTVSDWQMGDNHFARQSFHRQVFTSIISKLSFLGNYLSVKCTVGEMIVGEMNRTHNYPITNKPYLQESQKTWKSHDNKRVTIALAL